MNVNDLVQIRIADAARRIEAARRRRAEMDAARQRGLAQRHAAKLRHQAAAVATPEDPQPGTPPVENPEGEADMTQPTTMPPVEQSVRRIIEAAREPERQRADRAEAALARVQHELAEAAELDDLTTGELADRIREAMAARP